jgi:hypothetical protein
MDPYLFGLLIGMAPAVAVSIIGIVVAVERRVQHLRVSLLASLGLLAVIGARVGGVLLQLWIRDMALSGVRISAMTSVTAINYGLNGLSTIGLALITVAIFIDRKRQEPKT